MAILDFSKAFDTVSHDKLLHKVEICKIRGSVLKWLTSFLKERQMNVMVEGAYSDIASVESGIPQGTVLGPLLFSMPYKQFTKLSEISSAAFCR